MLSWFKSPKRPAADDSETAQATRVEPAQTVSEPEPSIAPEAEPAAATHIEPTPHDIALASVDARLQQLDDITQRPNRHATLDTTSDGTSQFHSLPADSVADTPRPSSTFIEQAHDPYTGNAVGVLSTVEHGAEHTQDLLWGHLANIRELQSDIARMHMDMEKLGQRQEHAPQDAARDFEDDFSTFIGTAPTSEAEAQKREADTQKRESERQEHEFNDLAMRFKERKQGIDNIMSKLHKLSDTVTAFHSMPAPTIRFSRNTTGFSQDHHLQASYPSQGGPPVVGTTGIFHPHAPLHDSPSSTQGSFSPVPH